MNLLEFCALPVDGDNEYAPEPRWPAVIAVLAVGGFHAALPPAIAVGPRWLVLTLSLLLLVPAMIAHWRGLHNLNHALAIALLGVLTVALVWSLCLLVAALPAHKQTSGELLRSAAALWTTNVLVFASWYWRLDAGGPHARDARPGHAHGAFLFPQMTLPDEDLAACGAVNWSPQFVDYLFLAFNSSTALSPTDAPVLSRWAKVLMMVQSSISLAIIALLAARAVNVLK